MEYLSELYDLDRPRTDVKIKFTLAEPKGYAERMEGAGLAYKAGRVRSEGDGWDQFAKSMSGKVRDEVMRRRNDRMNRFVDAIEVVNAEGEVE